MYMLLLRLNFLDPQPLSAIISLKQGHTQEILYEEVTSEALCLKSPITSPITQTRPSFLILGLNNS